MRNAPTAINTDPMIPITNQSPPRTYSIFHNSTCFFRGEHKTNTTFGTAPKHCPLGVVSNAELCLFLLTLYIVCDTLMNEVLQIFRADRRGLHARKPILCKRPQGRLQPVIGRRFHRWALVLPHPPGSVFV